MKASDKIIEAYYSDEVEEIKKKSKKSFILGCVFGIGAVLLFGVFILSIFSSIAIGFNLWVGLFIFVIGITFISFIPLAWFFNLRWISLANKAKQLIDEKMKENLNKSVSPNG